MVDVREARCSVAVAGTHHEGAGVTGIPHSRHCPGYADAPLTWQPITDSVTRVDGDRSQAAS